MKLYNTRFAALQYTCEAPSQWTIVDAESSKDNGFIVAIGAKYASKDELLADLERFAIERGYIAETKSKLVEYAYPSSDIANMAGFGSTGCWFVAIYPTVNSSTHKERIGFWLHKSDAIQYAQKLACPYNWQHAYLIETRLTRIENNLPVNMHEVDKSEYMQTHHQIAEIEDSGFNLDQLIPLRNRAHLIVAPYITINYEGFIGVVGISDCPQAIDLYHDFMKYAGNFASLSDKLNIWLEKRLPLIFA